MDGPVPLLVHSWKWVLSRMASSRCERPFIADRGIDPLAQRLRIRSATADLRHPLAAKAHTDPDPQSSKPQSSLVPRRSSSSLVLEFRPDLPAVAAQAGGGAARHAVRTKTG